MKRIMALALCFLLALPCFVFSVMAVEPGCVIDLSGYDGGPIQPGLYNLTFYHPDLPDYPFYLGDPFLLDSSCNSASYELIYGGDSDTSIYVYLAWSFDGNFVNNLRIETDGDFGDRADITPFCCLTLVAPYAGTTSEDCISFSSDSYGDLSASDSVSPGVYSVELVGSGLIIAKGTCNLGKVKGEYTGDPDYLYDPCVMIQWALTDFGDAISFAVVEVGDSTFLRIDADGNELSVEEWLEVRLTPLKTQSPFSPVKESMSSVLEWVGTVTTSLLSGELNPLLLLLAIPIAISLIFLAIKAIKMVFNF